MPTHTYLGTYCYIETYYGVKTLANNLKKSPFSFHGDFKVN